MSDGFSNPIIGGGGGLVYPGIHSPDFIAGVSGWAINKDGSAEFHDIELTGGSLIVTGAGEGLFLYSGTPAAGNLQFSIVGADGTDEWGNSYIKGVICYDTSGTPVLQMRPDLGAILVYGD